MADDPFADPLAGAQVRRAPPSAPESSPPPRPPFSRGSRSTLPALCPHFARHREAA